MKQIALGVTSPREFFDDISPSKFTTWKNFGYIFLKATLVGLMGFQVDGVLTNHNGWNFQDIPVAPKNLHRTGQGHSVGPQSRLQRGFLVGGLYTQ